MKELLKKDIQYIIISLYWQKNKSDYEEQYLRIVQNIKKYRREIPNSFTLFEIFIESIKTIIKEIKKQLIDSLNELKILIRILPERRYSANDVEKFEST